VYVDKIIIFLFYWNLTFVVEVDDDVVNYWTWGREWLRRWLRSPNSRLLW